LKTSLSPSIALSTSHPPQQQITMAEPQRDLEKLRAEQEKEDADILDDLEKESKAFDKVGSPSLTVSQPITE
jgi:hypothetical protein